MRTIKRRGLQNLAEMRLEEAEVFFDEGHYAGAYYLAGYAIECAIKACIAKKVKRHDFPDKEAVEDAYSHNLQKLADLADLTGEIENHRSVRRRWGTVKDWSEQSRYEPQISENEARSLLRAIRDPQDEVFQWLEQRW